MRFTSSRQEIKFISIAILFFNILMEVCAANQIKASQSNDELCMGIKNNFQCLETIKNLPPINNLPSIESNSPIPIKIIPYRKKYTSLKEKQRTNSTNLFIGDDNYLYELR